jgi:protein-disulfide isomerase
MLKPSVNGNDHATGPAHAPVTLVEYGDYQCPHCGHAYPILKEIQEALGDKLNFVFRNFPLSEMHPQAFIAALATEAAAKQDAYWPMHDIIFEHQQRLHSTDLITYARTLGLDESKFVTDMQNETLKEKVEADFESGVMSGVNGTPTFFINGARFNGGVDEDMLLDALKTAIAHPHHS